jgi:hypothetical protein
MFARAYSHVCVHTSFDSSTDILQTLCLIIQVATVFYLMCGSTQRTCVYSPIFWQILSKLDGNILGSCTRMWQWLLICVYARCLCKCLRTVQQIFFKLGWNILRIVSCWMSYLCVVCTHQASQLPISSFCTNTLSKLQVPNVSKGELLAGEDAG